MTNLCSYVIKIDLKVYKYYKSLKWLKSISDSSIMLMKCCILLSTFNFKPFYKPGNQNSIADIMSKLELNNLALRKYLEISTPTFTIANEDVRLGREESSKGCLRLILLLSFSFYALSSLFFVMF